ncbi:MAG TPA: TIGR03936 family radical SAM-associated protein [Chloroflexota bacterium]|nr:TIGR03936 family radical SAM-associated protein [Chloroflexota bacterium]
MSERQRLRILFRKGREARFLSHLDLLSTLQYSLRRAALPLELSEGFNPRPRMSLAAPLGVGHIGEREILEITLRDRVEQAGVRELLQRSVPDGITILEVEEMPAGRHPAAAELRSARFRIRCGLVPGLEQRLRDLMSRQTIEIEEDHGGRIRRRDIRPLILSASVDGEDLHVELALGSAGGVRPEHVLRAVGIDPPTVLITRERLVLNG